MKNSNRRKFNARSIGLIASEILSNNQDALVYGKSSRGIYIKTSSKWLIFLSFDQFRGPLTITLDEENPGLQHAPLGKSVRINSQSLSFLDTDMVVTFQGSEVWHNRLTSTPLSYDPKRQERLAWFTKEVLREKSGVGLSKLLPHLLGLPNVHSAPHNIGIFDWADIQGLQYNLRNGQPYLLARLLSNVLGSGPGLTPSGDDFVIGLLLTLNRWQNASWTADSLRELNVRLVEAAYAKTTSLSANLIECAMHGLGDERLVKALDWLATGSAREPEIIAHLLDWGYSSGIDAFAGMSVTLATLG